MRRRIFSSMCIISVLAILITSLLVTLVFYGDFREKMKNEVTMEASYLQAAVNQMGAEYLDELLEAPRNNSLNRITMIDTNGTVLFDNYYNPAAMENHLQRPEVQMALETGTGSQFRTSDTLQQQTYYYAVRLDNGKVLRLANTSNSVLASILRMVPLIVCICIGILILVLFLATKQTKKIVEPINEIDLEHPTDAAKYDELAPLLNRIEKQNHTIRLQMEELKVKQREFTALTENMSEGFLVVDKNSNVLSYNSSALELLGINGSIKERQNILTFNRSVGLQSVIESALAGNSSEQELQMEGRFCQVIANPVTSRGEIKGVVVVILDITEKQQREQMRREFSANVSHELKTPLTSISGYAEIIKNGLVKPEDIPRFAEHIYNETGRLISMVGDIIKLSQLDENMIELKQEEVDLFQLSKEVTERLQTNAKQNGISAMVVGEHCRVHGIRQILDEMIYNLCANAIIYNKEGGSVEVSVKKEEGCIILAVADTGIGIPEADQSRVFERFYRVDKSHSKQVGGTGLGLSIVKHGAIFHKAAIDMQSEVGKGTTVRIIWQV